MAPFTRERVNELRAQGFNAIPLMETLQLDRETPVSIYARFRDGRAHFLLESAALGDDTGRYSFIGLDRQWRISAAPDAGRLRGDAATTPDPLALIRERLAPYRAYQPSDVPSFIGGAVGYGALALTGSSSNTISQTFMVNASGDAADVWAGSFGNTISQSTIMSGR